MSTSLLHKCLECGKYNIADGQRGLQHHFDGANPLKADDVVCDAMTARACNHLILELTQQKKLDEKDRDRLLIARRVRATVRNRAKSAGRTLVEAGSPFHVE
jgi:hypothetical protein